MSDKMPIAPKPSYKFEPADDITVSELAEIVATLGIFVQQEWLERECPEHLKRHWVLKQETMQ